LATHPDVLDAYVKNKTSKDKSTEHTFKVEASFGEPPKTNIKKATQAKGEKSSQTNISFSETQ